MRHPSFIYFLRPIGAEGPVKIGCSRSPRSRLEQYLPWSPVPLEIAATVPGTMSLEYNLHQCFADTHIHHEWFGASPGLTKLIDALRTGAPLADAVDLNRKVGSIRKKGERTWGPWLRRYMSYVHRLRHAQDRASPAGDRLLAPDDVDDILDRGWTWDSKPPSEAALARLEQVIAYPAAHCILHSQKYPKAAAARAA